MVLDETVSRNKKALSQADQSKLKLQEQVRDNDKRISHCEGLINDKEVRANDL
jgi:hypothetical protein